MGKATSLIQRHQQKLTFNRAVDCSVSAKPVSQGFEMRVNYKDKMIGVLLTDMEARQLVKTLLGGSPLTFGNFNFEGIADENDDVQIVLVHQHGGSCILQVQDFYRRLTFLNRQKIQ